MLIYIMICVAIGAVLGHIRFAKSDPVRWHVDLTFEQDRDLIGGAQRVIAAQGDALTQIDTLARATARTQVLAGSLDEGHITYITRSRVFGFPDYTTVQQQGDQIKLYARPRFGRSDFGVNRGRVDGWLADLTL